MLPRRLAVSALPVLAALVAARAAPAKSMGPGSAAACTGGTPCRTGTSGFVADDAAGTPCPFCAEFGAAGKK
ncbi:hypothetical protein GWK16_09990 [Roseomonas sp. JC162]|uniref:Uncharacterized protein n=1 Tax=Neoroseomonas marina TaxID=1232220 RepID=A0A848EAP8_9PROT|nr:hypothetical protein [Neoroseomonas marina]NMJ41571.1 hypothetical protein [Neoroseomonas marina]